MLLLLIVYPTQHVYEALMGAVFQLGGPECIQAKSVTLLLVLKSPHLSFHPSQWPAHLLVKHFQLERTSKHANYVNRSIIFQPNFEPVYPLNARAEPFDFYIFCRAIHGLPVHIYIARVRLVKKKCTKICGNILRVSPRDEVAKNGHNGGRHSPTGIQSGFVNSREVPLRTLIQVRFVSAIAN